MSKLYPWAEAASAYQIDYQKEYDNGVRGVLFDVDNTLVRHGEPATKQAKKLFEHLRSIGLKTCIISNNKEPRVSPFAKEVGSDYIYKAGKPSVRGYEDCYEAYSYQHRYNDFYRRSDLYRYLWRKQSWN